MPDAPARFAWPPARTHAAPPTDLADHPPRPPRRASTPASGFRAALAAIEDIWLARSTPTLPERMAAAGWSPDAPGDYCPRCGTTSGPYAADDTGCGWCRTRDLPWARTVRLGSYEGLLRDLVLEVKFTAWRRLGTDLGRMLGRALADALESARIDRRGAAIVPVPMSFRRRMATGIDHTLVIARAAAAVAGIPVVRALARRHGPTQLDVPPSERARNANRSIRPRHATRLPWLGDPVGSDRPTVILLDDVRTTGATLTAAARAIHSTGSPQSRTRAHQSPQLTLWTAVTAVTPHPSGAPSQELPGDP